MQRGQAIVEFVVVLPVLLLFFFAAHWLLNLQHQKSSLQNQAANASWLLSRMASPDTDEDPAAQPLNAFKTQGSGSSGSFFQLPNNDATVLIVDGLSQELRTDDGGQAYRLSSSTVHAHPKHPKLQSISLSQSHVIMAGAGHAVAPDLVRRRIENSEALWARAHRNSRNAGRHITHYSAPVDAAWGRKGPTFDWLTAWEAEVPQRYTKKGAKP